MPCSKSGRRFPLDLLLGFPNVRGLVQLVGSSTSRFPPPRIFRLREAGGFLLIVGGFPLRDCPPQRLNVYHPQVALNALFATRAGSFLPVFFQGAFPVNPFGQLRWVSRSGLPSFRMRCSFDASTIRQNPKTSSDLPKNKNLGFPTCTFPESWYSRAVQKPQGEQHEQHG